MANIFTSKKKTEEMRKEIEKKSPQLQQVHTSKPSKFKEEDFTNTIKPKPRVARQKLAKSPESCFSDTEASPAGTSPDLKLKKKTFCKYHLFKDKQIALIQTD